jgi:hypothetical protein
LALLLRTGVIRNLPGYLLSGWIAERIQRVESAKSGAAFHFLRYSSKPEPLKGPHYSLRRIALRRRKPNPWFKRGTAFWSAIDVLRTAAKPLSGYETVEGMVAKKSVPGVAAGATRFE